MTFVNNLQYVMASPELLLVQIALIIIIIRMYKYMNMYVF